VTRAPVTGAAGASPIASIASVTWVAWIARAIRASPSAAVLAVARASRRAIALAVLVALAFDAAPSLAADPPRATTAERNFEDGRDAATRGDYQLACNLFRQSYALDPAAGTLINLGDCEEHLGHPEAALAYYERAFASLSVTDDRLPLVRSRIDGVERRSSRLALRIADGAPPDSQVTLDGQPVEAVRLSSSVLVSPGTHVIVVTAVGYRGSRQRVATHEGEARTIRLWPGPPLQVAAPGDIPSDEAIQARDARRATLRAAGYAIGALGVASVWVGSVTGLFAIDRAAIRSSHCDARDVCDPTGYDAARTGKTVATVSTITLTAGAAAIGGGLYLVLSNAGRAPRTAFDVAPSPGGGALRLVRTF